MILRVAFALLWLTRFLPLRVLAALGSGLGLVLYGIGEERRRVALVNLQLCFPDLAPQARARIARAHFQALARSILERGILWWSSAGAVRRLVRVEGEEHWRAVADRPIIVLAPHFIGCEMGGIRIHLDHPMATMYSKQRDAALDAMLLHGRTRFNEARVYSRQDGIRPIVRALRAGMPLFYLPDMDFGSRDAVFVPFFGVPAATITALSRLAAISGAAVIPCITRQLPGAQGYVARLYPAWDDFPGADVAADARRMNAFIEERVREMPEQYYWVHKRFKTRPPEDARRFYGD
jgi:Kdo2-lipid IVA lauroyltransferase/acyltransferase